LIEEVFVGELNHAETELTEPGRPVFYPKVGHCLYRGIVEDNAVPGLKLLELEDIEEGSRILVPVDHVPKLGLRPAGSALEEIREELSKEFEAPLETDEERGQLIEELVSEGSARGLAKALKRLHLIRQTQGLSREEEQTRRRIRSWLAAEVALARDCTRAEAQALITRILQEAMATHRKKEKEEAKERRRAAKAAEKKADEEKDRES
jgi:CarD family transcriptional regulator